MPPGEISTLYTTARKRNIFSKKFIKCDYHFDLQHCKKKQGLNRNPDKTGYQQTQTILFEKCVTKITLRWIQKAT